MTLLQLIVSKEVAGLIAATGTKVFMAELRKGGIYSFVISCQRCDCSLGIRAGLECGQH